MDIEELEKHLGLSENTDEKKENNQELEDIINLLNSSNDDIINLEGNEGTFEGLSQEELDVLMKQDDEIMVEDIDTDIINDISVYDNKPTDEDKILEKLNDIENEETQVEQELKEDTDKENVIKETSDVRDDKKKDKKIKIDKSSIIIISVSTFLILLIILTIIFFTISIKKANSIALQNEIKKDNIISKYKPEDKNTIYFDMAQNVDKETLILEKMHINKLNTTFYFKNKIDLMKYNIVLTDKDKNLYPMDLNFTKDGSNDKNTILRFNTIDGSVKNFVLIIESIATGEKAVFNLNFNAKLEKETIKYINSPISNSFGDYNVNVNYAEFSDKFSRVDYTIEPVKDAIYQIQQGIVNEENYIKLKENDTYISPLSNKPVTTILDNKIIGRMDFKNINKDANNLVLQLENIYKKYPINKKISLQEIKKGNISYDFDKYKLFIEGMPNFDNTYVLVMNAKDTTIGTQNRPDDFNNIETKLDVEIVANSSNGVEFIISPTNIKSAKYGTDIIFELDKAQASILNSVSEDNLYINIKSALIKEENVNVPINLNRAMEREIISHQLAEEKIKEAFKSRIENKAKGFSSEVLNDIALEKEYSSLPKGKKKIALNIVSKNIQKDYLEAIIQEAIQIEDKENIKVLYRFHKIKANNVDDKLNIYYDKIIK